MELERLSGHLVYQKTDIKQCDGQGAGEGKPMFSKSELFRRAEERRLQEGKSFGSKIQSNKKCGVEEGGKAGKITTKASGEEEAELVLLVEYEAGGSDTTQKEMLFPPRDGHTCTYARERSLQHGSRCFNR